MICTRGGSPWLLAPLRQSNGGALFFPMSISSGTSGPSSSTSECFSNASGAPNSEHTPRIVCTLLEFFLIKCDIGPRFGVVSPGRDDAAAPLNKLLQGLNNGSGVKTRLRWIPQQRALRCATAGGESKGSFMPLGPRGCPRATAGVHPASPLLQPSRRVPLPRGGRRRLSRRHPPLLSHLGRGLHDRHHLTHRPSLVMQKHPDRFAQPPMGQPVR